MTIVFTSIVFLFVAAVLALAAYALYECTPFRIGETRIAPKGASRASRARTSTSSATTPEPLLSSRPRRPVSSSRSATTTWAPWARRACARSPPSTAIATATFAVRLASSPSIVVSNVAASPGATPASSQATRIVSGAGLASGLGSG